MPSDISRKTFNRKKHYSGVLMQQGRVQLDADWNEQLDIQQYRTNIETIDVIGQSGVPKSKDGGFEITPLPHGNGFGISPGRMYVGGFLCELENRASYFNQPYYPEPDIQYFIMNAPASPPGSPLAPPPLPLSPPASPPSSHINLYNGVYLVYIDAWQREVNYLDDALIQEVALGEADTTTRLQTVWQVKLLKLSSDSQAPYNCKTYIKDWEDLIRPPGGKLNARTNKDLGPEDPCSLKPRNGFKGLENQLYRVEIQKGGNRDTATFKWSRDNATLETSIETINGSVITVSSIGKDEIMSFGTGQWVEIVDRVSMFNSKPKQLLKITAITPATREITLDSSLSKFVGKKGLKLRRWDQPVTSGTTDGIPMGTGWEELEDGIEIKFSATGMFRPGDFWLIPARTAKAEIEWPPYIPGVLPIEQSPKGVEHFYARLAMLYVNDGFVTWEDCREIFPSLTHICAEDVCYDNNNCDLSGAQNVQEALDLLCAANDLRDHNKHLHGYGVVCGLKVKCGVDRESVTVEKGYALDCNGNIIRLKNEKGIRYNAVATAQTSKFLDNSGNGEVCLSISYQGQNEPVISMEKYVKKSFWEEVLEGSLIKDFFDQDILPLVNFLKKQLPFPLTDTPPVPIGQQRLTALINLLLQLVNSASGPYIFLSGQKRTEDCTQKPEVKQYEDQLLYCLYKELKQLLASETFCAMFDNDHPFPVYKIEPGLDTIFGPTLKFHRRLRLNPKGKFSYTCGMDNKIYVYNLETMLLHQTLVFPATANIKLQDIAVSLKGDELYAVALLDDKDTVIAVVSIDVTTGKHVWVNGASVKCAFKYVSLGISGTNLYAVAKAKGLYKLSGVGTLGFTETPVKVGFNPTGLMIIPEGKDVAYFAHNKSTASETDSFTDVDSLDLNTNASKTFHTGGNNNGDDICLHKGILYATTTSAGNRAVVGFSTVTTVQVFGPIILESSSTLRLAALPRDNNIDYLLVSMSDKYKVVRIDLLKTVDTNFRIPVQLFPMAMVLDPKAKTGYVLNSIVNTLTVIDIEKTFKTPQPNFTEEPPVDIADYHDDVIEAYKDLVKHLLQYLKDAFCNRFLVDCPECFEKDKVYLGSVKIRNNKVYRICNFSKRKYVKTFRTWGYWLSTIPILPALKVAFAKFCCKVLDKKSS